MKNQNSIDLNLGYDESRESPFFCDDPRNMRCCADGFGNFYFQFAGRLENPNNRDTIYGLPSLEHTGMGDVDYRSISIIVARHNQSVEANSKSAVVL